MGMALPEMHAFCQADPASRTAQTLPGAHLPNKGFWLIKRPTASSTAAAPSIADRLVCKMSCKKLMASPSLQCPSDGLWLTCSMRVQSLGVVGLCGAVTTKCQAIGTVFSIKMMLAADCFCSRLGDMLAFLTLVLSLVLIRQLSMLLSSAVCMSISRASRWGFSPANACFSKVALNG